MAVSFSGIWTDEIASVTDSAEYQTCEVKIVDPLASEVGSSHDPVTDEWIPGPDLGIRYEGRARFIPVRASTYMGGEAQANATSIRAVRFQIPRSEVAQRIKTGYKIQITAAPHNPSLLEQWATVTTDFQGSSTAQRTIEAMMDGDG